MIDSIEIGKSLISKYYFGPMKKNKEMRKSTSNQWLRYKFVAFYSKDEASTKIYQHAFNNSKFIFIALIILSVILIILM